MEVVLIRHGESVWNKENLFTGWTDVELSDKGQEEAKQAGRLLKELGYDFDLCYTSYLKRAIHTLDLILDEIDRAWLPVVKSWKLNERHYGALQGLNKTETANKYGEDQVRTWRRSYDVKPPLLEEADKRSPKIQSAYRSVNKENLPLGESLKDTIGRVVPYYEQMIKKEIEDGKRVLIVAHGNSIRALIMHIEELSSNQIKSVDIPTGVPLVYELDQTGKVISKKYLGDQEQIQDKMKQVVNQGRKVV